SIKANGKEIRKVLTDIERKSGVRFTYSSAVVDVNREVSIDFDDRNLSEVLNNIFASEISYEVRGNRIILKPGRVTASNTDDGSATPHSESYFAVEISGKVTDENGQSLPGANVMEKGTTNGTTTDVDGNFKLSVMGPNSVLVIS